MLLSCKCLNFTALSNSQQENSNSEMYTAPLVEFRTKPQTSTNDGGDCTTKSTSFSAIDLMPAFLQKYSTTFPFYSQCINFFKQSVGPISDLAFHSIKQRDLVYYFSLDIQPAGAINPDQPENQIWQMCICVNCNTVLCAKKILSNLQNQSFEYIGDILSNTQQQQFFLDYSLLTNSEELSQRSSGRSFSEIFGVLMMDHPEFVSGHNFQQQSAASNKATLASISSTNGSVVNLQQNLQTRLQKEIANTDVRIQRYAEQQFSLLKNFRDKSEQEFKLLASLVQTLTEQCKLSEKAPALDVNGGAFGICTQRGQNITDSRYDISAAEPSTFSTTSLPAPNLLRIQKIHASSNSVICAIDTDRHDIKSIQLFTYGELARTRRQKTDESNFANQRKVSNLNTQPTTSDATPMSVGSSSRTFRQQQNNTSFGDHPIGSNSFQQQFSTPTTKITEEYIFELEGVLTNTTISSGFPDQRHNSIEPTKIQHRNNCEMSSLSGSTEKAEDALCLNSSLPTIVENACHEHVTTGQMLRFAKSLPIQIANFPLSERTDISNSYESDLENTPDIAASIKALAKSVRGEAVFGDLPSPRLSSQI